MLIVTDTSALIAVLTGEESRRSLLRLTQGAELLAPASVHWEIGNAVVALVRRGQATPEQAIEVIERYEEIPLRIVEVDLERSVRMAFEHRLYAYDAYVLACAMRYNAPLLTLDKALARAAAAAAVEVLEVD